MTRVEFAAYISTHLQNCGIDVVLSGGSCVSIYSNESYVSGDLDFIRTGLIAWKAIHSVMKELGFHEESRYFKHSESIYFVEFPGGPLSVGEEAVRDFNLIETETGVLKLLTPTDCIKDRLAAFYHWKDIESLEQAMLVARNQKIDLKAIETWSQLEGKDADFLLIKDRFISTTAS